MKSKEYLRKEVFISNTLETLDQACGTKTAYMILVEKSMPCVLHVNMIISDKFAKMILQEVLNKYLDIANDFICEVETHVNTRVFGKRL